MPSGMIERTAAALVQLSRVGSEKGRQPRRGQRAHGAHEDTRSTLDGTISTMETASP